MGDDNRWLTPQAARLYLDNVAISRGVGWELQPRGQQAYNTTYYSYRHDWNAHATASGEHQFRLEVDYMVWEMGDGQGESMASVTARL